ncbi:MAG: hypothetical protein ACUVSX_14825 [Aggregatilineales bacterium]
MDFEALVGHLYIVGGHAISAPPPGALVEVAPRQAVRGREMDTIFTLALPTADAPAPGRFFEQLAEHAAERYFASSGSVTAGIRAVFTTLNQNLYDYNASGKRRYEAALLCAVLHGSDLYLARAGAAVALLSHGDTLESFPDIFSDEHAFEGAPLGRHPVPDTKLSRYRIASGVRLALADMALARLSCEAMRSALGAAHIGEVLAGFKALAANQLTLLVVEFVPPDAPAPLPVREGESTRELTAPEPPAAARAAAPAPAARANPLAGVVSEARFRAQRSAGAAALSLADSLDAVSSALAPPAASPAAPPRRWLSPANVGRLVWLLPVTVVVLVLLMWLAGTGQSEFELCVADANREAERARAIASSDRTGTLAAWNAVLIVVERCESIRAGDPALAALVREGQQTIDLLSEIERRDVVPIAAFPNAALSRVILRGEDLYVLDDNNDQVYRVTLASTGLSILPNSRQPIINMRRGATVGQFTLGDIVDIAWADDGTGLSQGNVLIAMDRNGVIVEYSPTFLARGVQRLLGTENWVNPVRIHVWQGRLYILDTGANQIWRYDPSGGAFPGGPLEYFTGQNRPALANAVDFAIDPNGRVFILFREGIVTVFRAGQQQPFGFAGFPDGQSITSAEAMYFNANPISQSIYFASRATRTIFETSQAGTFFNSYRSYDESQFAALSNVVADDNRQVIYALSGNAILAFRK